MNVLILSCNTGGGHNAAAQAVAGALRRRGHSCKTVDYLALASDHISKEICGAYVSIVNNAPNFFNLLYKAGEAVSSPRRRSPIYYVNKCFVRRLRRELAANHYDAVVVSHIFAAQALTELRLRGELDIPFISVTTDYTCSPFWEEIHCDCVTIPHPDLIPEFVEHGLDPALLLPCGIPVSDACHSDLTPAEARAQLGLPQDQPVILLAGGSMGHGSQRELIDALLSRSRFDPFIVVVCGSNEKEKASLEKRYAKRPNVQIRGFERRLPLLMRAASVTFTKPGGLSSTEAAVVNTPLIFRNAIPGCETHNQDFFVSRGMAYAPDSPRTQSKAARLLCISEEYRTSMLEAQKDIPGNAADAVCDKLEELLAQKEALT